MTTEHRKAPRKRVTEILRVGTWGHVVYEHRLECGHTEKRPRVASSKHLACVQCLRSNNKELEIRALSQPAKTIEVDLHNTEIQIARVKAKLSHALGVSLEQIDVSVVDKFGEQQITGAVLFLSQEDVIRITGKH